MAQNFVIRANRINMVHKVHMYKNQADTITVDFSPWADDNGTVSACTATVKSGQVAIGNEALASNVKTMVLTTDEVGGSIVKLDATAGNNSGIVYFYIYCKEPYSTTDDYGLYD